MCAICGSALVRSRVRWWESWRTFVTKNRPYRCIDCRRRGWRPVFESPPVSPDRPNAIRPGGLGRYGE